MKKIFFLSLVCGVACNILAMKDKEIEPIVPGFIHFQTLSFDLQRNIFAFLDNRSHLRQLNKEFYTIWSIKNPFIFTNDLCGLQPEHMVRIALNAAYQRNYDGLENILNKSSLLQYCREHTEGRIYYAFKTDKNEQEVIDIDIIGLFSNDRKEKLRLLLPKYKVVLPTIHTMHTSLLYMPQSNTMACLAGDSDAISESSCDNIIELIKNILNLKKDLYIAIACNYVKCMQKCVDLFMEYKKKVLNPQDPDFGIASAMDTAFYHMYKTEADQINTILEAHPITKKYLDYLKEKKAQEDTEKLNAERKMTFLEKVCTIS